MRNGDVLSLLTNEDNPVWSEGVSVDANPLGEKTTQSNVPDHLHRVVVAFEPHYIPVGVRRSQPYINWRDYITWFYALGLEAKQMGGTAGRSLMMMPPPRSVSPEDSLERYGAKLMKARMLWMEGTSGDGKGLWI